MHLHGREHLGAVLGYRALVLAAALLLFPLTSSAATEARCTELGDNCVCAESMDGNTVDDGDPTWPLAQAFDPDWSPNETECARRNDPPTQIVRGVDTYWNSNAFCESALTAVAASTMTAALPAGHSLDYVMKHVGTGACHVGHATFTTHDDNVTHCLRLYRRWDDSLMDWPNSISPCEQAKIMTMGGSVDTPGDPSVTIQTSLVCGQTEAGTRWDSATFAPPEDFQGLDDVQANCTDNFCYFETCWDWTDAGIASTRFRFRPVSPGSEVLTTVQKPAGTIANTSLSFNLGDIGTATGVSMHSQGISPAADWHSHMLFSRVRPVNPDFWIGPASEFEGTGEVVPQVTCGNNGPIDAGAGFSMTLNPANFTEAGVEANTYLYDMTGDGTPNTCASQSGTLVGESAGTCDTPNEICTCTVASTNDAVLTVAGSPHTLDCEINGATEDDAGTTDLVVEEAPVAASFSVTGAWRSTPPSSGGGTDFDWQPLKVGAGGWLTGISVSSDGLTKVVRTDTYGAYILNGLTWDQLVTSDSMPADVVSSEQEDTGVYEVAVAPSDANRIYLAWKGSVFRSEDRGASFVETNFTPISTMNPNNVAWRTYGQKMAVNPDDSDEVLLGTEEDDLWFTDDGGDTWTQVGASFPPAAEQEGITGITYANSAIVYASSAGNGVYNSVNGTVWFQISDGTDFTPDECRSGAAEGLNFYCIDSNGNVWRFNNVDAWDLIKQTPGAGGGHEWHSVTLDPYDTDRIVIVGEGGWMAVSRDRGDNWDPTITTLTRESTADVGWLEWTEETYMSNGAVIFDPQIEGKLWFAQGIGVWTTTLDAGAQSTVAWTSLSAGIEQLVGNSIAVSPASGAIVLAAYDRPLFKITDPDVYPTTHQPGTSFGNAGNVTYIATNPEALVAFNNDRPGGTYIPRGMTSGSGGATWNNFPSQPTGSTDSEVWGFGIGAASTNDNWCWAPALSHRPYCTTDGGNSWLGVTLPDVANDTTFAGWKGLMDSRFYSRFPIAADEVNDGVFYAYHHGDPSSVVEDGAGVFRSTDGGAHWSLMKAGEITKDSLNGMLRAVPDHEGHLFYTAGHFGGSFGAHADADFMFSDDGGDTWSVVPNVLEVHAFGFGSTPTGGSYPRIYIAGYVNNVYGIYRSVDQAVTWERIGIYPMGVFDRVRWIEGSRTGVEKVYIAFRGSGFAYGEP